ncbi:PDDEXK nuclease domain-containing protein [Franzmannia qiaohouensis]|uniref:PDDEXK nuclease domain-containing protein n=1 Tax=Franzmannia qiaohouensis TaxID=1329370 RepID=A0ABU1HH25_9GAMM|nr:PDDEXK nuclease domain-containing protein [Halomonas qiaohouensis]MDR5906778.1 PDDEXK nuclease domain-containing protein [Halomonas qiaohouensis]
MSDKAVTDPALVAELRELIDGARQRAAVAINAELTLLYWQLGSRIYREILCQQRADYGEERVSALRRQLSWTHIKILVYLEDPLKREFYLELAQLEGWSSRQLQERIQSMLFERSAISKKPEATIRRELTTLREEGQASPALLLKDPYLLDFLGLNDRYLERDLEDAILREIEQFLLELGAGFTFVGRQQRIQIDDEDFYIDLLFYNRKLKRLVAIDLKLGRFKAEYKGQMELYLRWLARHEQEVGENPPLGIILCAGKQREQIELLELDKSGIHVAEYLTVLPSREILEAKLHQSMVAARARLLGSEGEPRN